MPIGVIIILIATLTGLILINKIRPVYFSLIVILLFLSSCNEILALYIFSVKQKVFAYNIFSLIEIAIWFIAIYYTAIFKNRKILIVLLFLILALSTFEIITKRGFHSMSYRLFSVFIIATSILYFHSLLNTKKEHYLLVDGKFWLFLGLLLFHFVFLFYLTALDFKEFKYAKDAMLVFREILNLTNILYYTSISIGLICFSYSRQ